MAPMAQMLVACALPIHALRDAFRTGDGVPYADYGEDLHEGQARFTRPLFDALLATEWLPAVPGDPRRASQAGGRHGWPTSPCGQGRSSIAIARGYPGVTVDGIDSDAASIAAAQDELAGSGVEDRVAFVCRDAADADAVRAATTS